MSFINYVVPRSALLIELFCVILEKNTVLWVLLITLFHVLRYSGKKYSSAKAGDKLIRQPFFFSQTILKRNSLYKITNFHGADSVMGLKMVLVQDYLRSYRVNQGDMANDTFQNKLNKRKRCIYFCWRYWCNVCVSIYYCYRISELISHWVNIKIANIWIRWIIELVLR